MSLHCESNQGEYDSNFPGLLSRAFLYVLLSCEGNPALPVRSSHICAHPPHAGVVWGKARLLYTHMIIVTEQHWPLSEKARHSLLGKRRARWAIFLLGLSAYITSLFEICDFNRASCQSKLKSDCFLELPLH